MLLGGNKPVQSHSSSQPFSSLYLHTHPHTNTHTHQLCQKNRTLTTVLLKSRLCVCVSGVLYVIIGELFEDLTEDLVFERLGLQRSFKDQICELVD